MSRPAVALLVSALRQLGVATVAASLVTATALQAYDRFVLRTALSVGVVDLAEVYLAKEAEFTRLLTRASTEEDRERALALARAFAKRLPAALDELPRECACVVLAKSAVAGAPHARDLTPLLRQKVHLP